MLRQLYLSAEPHRSSVYSDRSLSLIVAPLAPSGGQRSSAHWSRTREAARRRGCLSDLIAKQRWIDRWLRDTARHCPKHMSKFEDVVKKEEGRGRVVVYVSRNGGVAAFPCRYTPLKMVVEKRCT